MRESKGHMSYIWWQDLKSEWKYFGLAQIAIVNEGDRFRRRSDERFYKAGTSALVWHLQAASIGWVE